MGFRVIFDIDDEDDESDYDYEDDGDDTDMDDVFVNILSMLKPFLEQSFRSAPRAHLDVHPASRSEYSNKAQSSEEVVSQDETDVSQESSQEPQETSPSQEPTKVPPQRVAQNQRFRGERSTGQAPVEIANQQGSKSQATQDVVSYRTLG
jgi:hypothetical protein